jgi:hypothetical protein
VNLLDLASCAHPYLFRGQKEQTKAFVFADSGREGKEEGDAGSHHGRVPKLNGLSTSPLFRECQNTAVGVSWPPCLCDVNSTKACSPAWLPLGPSVPQILWFQLCHFPKQCVLAVCQLHYWIDMPSLTLSTPGTSWVRSLSNRESTRLSTRESLQRILTDSVEPVGQQSGQAHRDRQWCRW